MKGMKDGTGTVLFITQQKDLMCEGTSHSICGRDVASVPQGHGGVCQLSGYC